MNDRDLLLRKPILIVGLAFVFIGLAARPASAQVNRLDPDARVVVSGLISEGTCALLSLDPDVLTSSASVDALSFLSRQVQSEAASLSGPFVGLALNLALPVTSESCTSVAGQSTVLSFDRDLASITAYDGLLQNTASRNPAGNVFVQLGLISAQGAFAPVDLNQPQVLNRALRSQLARAAPASVGPVRLGVRYVSDPPILASGTGSLPDGIPLEARVTPGNFRVYIPFLQKLN